MTNYLDEAQSLDKVIIAGGGTGGHLYPGLAVAGELKKRNSNMDILFIGTENGIEATILPLEGYNIKFIKAGGFVRVSLMKKIAAIYKMFISLFEMYSFYSDWEPDLVIGTGGYASFVPVLIAALMSIPTVILEQNSVPGLSNKLLGRFVDRICITDEGSSSAFPKEKIFITGNPVRDLTDGIDKKASYKLFGLDETKFTILIFGGSAGAVAINNAIMEAIVYLMDIKENIQFLHQSGKADYEPVRQAYMSYDCKGTVAPFIYQMPQAYAVADIVISRAGATTLAEITSLGIPSILIPYPYAALGHQESNARRLSSEGAAIMIKEDVLTGKELAEEIKKLYLDTAYREKIRGKSRVLGKPDAAKRVLEIILNLYKYSE
ncbi:MAG: undecaprenyldiphospho-muramoylpentapeptide beta-N-acetylglucosaminyltransferase [Nitrospirae bacterium]|nr:undecaprenyldiphospho-muramoylpentapeptide beta-N-acetylglucosaminyltransferase [Nitrospirota bacterium]MBF0540689.1 undecaprenyldiphospho-muramoylpentapeptide beta-N-acetylglucosaminyltransferase [Nitrospirota bacterium]